MGPVPRLTLALSILLVAGGCAPAATTSSLLHRDAPTDIEPGEKVAVALKSHVKADGTKVTGKEIQESFERCIQAGIRNVDKQFMLGHLGEANVRYRVDVEVTTRHTAERSTLEAGVVQFVPAVAIGSKWLETTTFSAKAFDVKQGRQAFRLDSSATREQEAGVGVALVVPIPYSSRHSTVYDACRKFGESLAHVF